LIGLGLLALFIQGALSGLWLIFLGWFLMFAVRRYKVQWGAFASFMAIVFGVSLMSFLYAKDLLAYYGIGIFLGFVANMVVRVAGTAAGELAPNRLELHVASVRSPHCFHM